LLDRTQTTAARVAAAGELAMQFPDYDAWKALCSVAIAEDDDADVRIAVIRALPEWNRGAAMEMLVRAYEDQRVRRAALATLDELGFAAGRDETLLMAELTALRGKATAEYVARVLGSLSGTVRDVLSIRLTALGKADPIAVRSAVADLPQRYGRDARVLEFLRETLRSSDSGLRATAAAGLCRLGEIAAILESAHDPSPEVRGMLASVLGLYREEQGGGALTHLLEDSDADVVQEARKALRLLGRLERATPVDPGSATPS
jgi:HEAT repeat protein